MSDTLKDELRQIIVEVTGQPNLWFFSHTATGSHTVRYDSIPPKVDVLSGQHYLRQGGSEAVLYRVFEEGTRSGVQVGPSGPVGPVGPVGPLTPVAPVAPVAPTSSPVGPLPPCGPVGPIGPFSPTSSEGVPLHAVSNA